MRRTMLSNLAVILMIGLGVSAQAPKGSEKALKSTRIDLASEVVGGEAKTFLSVVGNWVIVQDEGKKVLMVDGREWKRGQPAGGLADKLASSTARVTKSSSTM